MPDYIVGQQTYATLKSAAAACNTKSRNIIEYAQYHGISYQEALDHFYARPAREYTVRGVSYKSFPDAMAAVPVKRATLSSWKSRHCKDATQQELLDAYVTWYDAKEAVIVDGIHYSSIRSAVEGVGWTWEAALKYRQWHKCTWQEAVDSWLDKIPLQSLRRLSDAREIYQAYLGVDGKGYYSCVCPICNRGLLLSQSSLINFVHSDEFCCLHENPIH